ncbi:MAG: YsnF/AvaK domain-containing protein [Enterobacterales bacterium endosymbiont of Blomia tropicalis]|uniref:YsnF/AvaK domain-containing protein n=1 Tax=Mixta mediterraneensis TaxID=2758443 RepID=UPI0025A6AA6F|nr:YsnF/AvaK domain-containing protein [Mixta mediterraneensis]MDL4916009.1 YsnF/AvaK domain-containing protein [Mixta mediterraneensis]
MSDNRQPASPEPENKAPDADCDNIPLYREVLHAGKETVPEGEVCVRRTTVTRQVPVTETLTTVSASVEVIPVGRYVDEVPRQVSEDGVMIIPVYEERVEMVKRIYLKEEVRITTTKSEQAFSGQAEAREQLINITRNKK